MNFREYSWKVSTYRPVELGDVEFEILSYFANGSSFSTYEVFKKFNKVRATSPYTRAKTPTLYKNIHKRVKRLAQLKLIEETGEYSDRRAKHYRVSTYGLISFAGREITESDHHIKHNKKDIVIQCLLLQFFEEKTIDSASNPFSQEICYYLHDCCSVTISICRQHWNKIKQYNIEDILPSDEAIQKYMSYLDDNKVDQSILNEITEYEKKLLRKSQISNFVKSIYPTFPLEDIHSNIVSAIQDQLSKKIESLASTLVTRLGELVAYEEIKSKEEIEKILESIHDYFLSHVLKDKKFFELVSIMKKNFDLGYRQFLYYRRC